ncbi:MAG: hypothetical protein V3V89_00445 [Gammaproteobacteria bacterium]
MIKAPVDNKKHSKNLGNIINVISAIPDKYPLYTLAKRFLPLKTMWNCQEELSYIALFSATTYVPDKGFFPLRIMEYDDDCKHN